jgi:hypothetical protein
LSWILLQVVSSEKSIPNPVEHNSQHIKINYCAINVTGQYNVKPRRQCVWNINSRKNTGEYIISVVGHFVVEDI